MLTKLKLWLLVVIILSGCASDLKKPNYEFGDKSNLDAIRWGGVVRQELDFSCGLTSVATILKYHFGDETITERSLLADFIGGLSPETLAEVYSKGASMAQLSDVLKSKGYIVRNQRLQISDLRSVTKLMVPAIVYLETPDFRHFAVVRGVSDYQVSLADSSRGNVKMSIEAFLTEWKGRRALLVAHSLSEIENALLAEPDPKEADARTEMIRSIVVRPK